jgi:hypothetical protein
LNGSLTSCEGEFQRVRNWHFKFIAAWRSNITSNLPQPWPQRPRARSTWRTTVGRRPRLYGMMHCLRATGDRSVPLPAKHGSDASPPCPRGQGSIAGRPSQAESGSACASCLVGGGRSAHALVRP